MSMYCNPNGGGEFSTLVSPLYRGDTYDYEILRSKKDSLLTLCDPINLVYGGEENV